MKAAVIGSRGFVGSAVVEDLCGRGYHVIAIDRTTVEDEAALPHGAGQVQHRRADIRDPEALMPLLRGVDEVYHFAARLGTSELEEDLRGCIESNILGALNVFEAATRSGVARVFYASKPSVWLNVYTLTKHCGEQIARLMTRYHPTQIRVLRYLNIYGPGQKLFSARKILPVFAAQALRRLPLQVYGDGLQTVDMLYVKDAARITVDYMQTKETGEPCDCGTGTEMTVLEVAEAVNRYLSNEAGVHHVPMRKGETPRTRLVADLSGLRALSVPLEVTPFDLALAQSLDWYAARPPHEMDAALAYHGIHQRYGVSWN
jgi:nucleoside-diphosphate-sugar epimerase